MSRRLPLLTVLLALGLTSVLNAATIIWVSDNKDPETPDPITGAERDLVWVELLEANGYTVNRNFLSGEARTLDDAKLEVLNAADLIIVSKNTNSPDYINGDEPTQWNSLKTPIIVQILEFTRSSNWRWLNTTTRVNARANLTAVLPSHPIFVGVALDQNNDVNIISDVSTLTTYTNPGNGTLIGKRADNNGVWIVEWEKGQEYYTESGQFAGGPRMWFAAGRVSNHRDGEYNLTEEGRKLFLNAVSYMAGLRRLTASKPNPGDGSVYSEPSVNLTWMPGYKAASHNVYVGQSLADVNAGTGGTFRDNVTAASFTIGVAGAPYPAGLVSGTTYYWRIDEVNTLEPNAPWKGEVWSFTVASKTATNPVPADGAVFVDRDMDLSWDTGFNAKSHTVYLDTDYTAVDTGTTGTTIPSPQYDPGALLRGKTYYWRVDEFDGTATYRGTIWSFTTVPDIPVQDPNLLVWWAFDEPEAHVLDTSGHDHHGTIRGATWSDSGQVGGALEFGGDGAYVVYGDGSFLNGLSAITVCAWVQSNITGTDSGFISLADPNGSDFNGMRYDAAGATGGGSNVLKISVVTEAGNQQLESSIDLQTTTWQHCALVWSAGEELKFYVNGTLDTPTANAAAAGTVTSGFQKIVVGKGPKDSGPSLSWNGLIDEFRVYNRALTEQELQQILRGDPNLAWNPQPRSGATAQIPDVTALQWMPGALASQHDVYFGMNADAVKNAGTSSPEYKGRQTGTSYPVAGLIQMGGGPYYWRIDEVNTNGSVIKGQVWRFTIAGYVGIDDFETYDPNCARVYYTWKDGLSFEANPICGVQAYSGNGTGATAGHANSPYVARTAAYVHGGHQSMPLYYDNNRQDSLKYSEATLKLTGGRRNWSAYGLKALSLWYIGFPAALGSFVEAPAGTCTMTAGGEDIWDQADQFHFAWKMIDSTGSIEARVVSLTEADTWTKAGLMIRGSLDANAPNVSVFVSPNNSRVRMQSRGVAGGNTTASGEAQNITIAPHWLRIERDIFGTCTVSHANDVGGVPDTWTQLGAIPGPMTAYVYIGLALTSHSIGNKATAVFSNVTLTGFTQELTFTAQDVGIQSNAPEPMYVLIKDGKGQGTPVYNPDPNAAQRQTWTPWGQYGEGIVLSSLSGIDLTDVDSISLGFGTKGSAQPGGAGLVYFDDIRLYGPRCVPLLAKPAGDCNNDCTVDIRDLVLLAGEWLQSNSTLTADLNTDGTVDLKDYARLAGSWLGVQLWP